MIVCGREKWSNPWTSNDDIDWKIDRPEVGQWSCIAGFTCWAQTTSGGPYGNGWRKKYLPEVLLICSKEDTRISVELFKLWNCIWSKSSTWSNYPGRFKIILHPSQRGFSLSTGQRGDVNGGWWGCGGNAQDHAGGINLLFSSRNVVLALTYSFLSRGSSRSFCLAFSTRTSLTSKAKESMWGFCQVLSWSVPIMFSRSGRHPWMNSGTIWAQCEIKSIENLTSISLCSEHWATVIFWVFCK